MIKKRDFGQLSNGHKVHAFDLSSNTGLRATVVEFGATLQAFELQSGLDVVLGFDDLAGYAAPHPCFGAAIGRTANRTGRARFEINGEAYSIPANEGPNNLHGKPDGFDQALWTGRIEEDVIDGERLVLTHISPDGHQGYPGKVTAQMIFSLKGHTLSLDMTARTDKTTPINLTHHNYFNLTDGGASSALDHEITIMCDDYLEMDAENIPTGAVMDVADTPMDYLAAKAVAPNLDDCFVKHRDADNKAVNKVVKLTSKTTGNMLIICSSQPALQVYSGGHIPRMTGKSGIAYAPNHGIALEPQNFLNAVNEKSFPNSLLEPETLYHQTIRYTLKGGAE